MSDAFYIDRLDEWLDGMTKKDLKELDYRYLGDTQVQLGHYEHIFEKGLELIKCEPHPKELLLKILDEYMVRLDELPTFTHSMFDSSELDEKTREKMKSLVLFGTQATLIKENAKIQSNLKIKNQNYQDLLGIVTHEFKNSLTSIYGYNRIINKRVKEGRIDELPEITGQVDRLTKKLFNVIDALLNMSLIDQGRLKASVFQFQLIADVIAPVISEMELQVSEKKMAIEVISPEDDVIMQGDSELMQIVFRNLIINAIQYGKESTDIEIHMERVRDRVLIDIMNWGAGLERKYLNWIFDKFSRFHSKSKNTNVGIGLFTVKHIIELHHGSIKAESHPGEWMRFIMNLPLKQE